jgi:hypothetical protein
MTIALLSLASPARAQRQPSGTSAQETPPAEQKAPGDQSQAAGALQKRTKQLGRVFGIMPNYTTVEPGSHPPPLTVGTKFKIAAKMSFDPYAFVVAGFSAAIGQAENSDPSWGQGLSGYGKRTGSAFASQAIGNFMKGAVFPSLLHQDPRYFRLGKGSFAHRFGYSLSRIVVARSDSGTSQFNYSRVAGNASAAAISNIYRPPEERTVSSTMSTFGTQIAIDLLGNELKEFWPDIHRKLLRSKN